jgi:hypothetical protein
VISARRKKNTNMCCHRSRTALAQCASDAARGNTAHEGGECREGRETGKDGVGEGGRKSTRVDSIAHHLGFLRAFWKKKVSRINVWMYLRHPQFARGAMEHLKGG